jgi:hypothetical protein
MKSLQSRIAEERLFWHVMRGLFWHVMRVLFVLGLASWTLLAWIEPPEPSWTQIFLEFGIWMGAAALCALLLKSLLGAQDTLHALATLWPPLLVLSAAAYVLFFNDQGREFGLSLMRQKYVFSAIFLFLTLGYWAANNWHTARLGIRSALQRGELGVPPSHPWNENPRQHDLRGDELWPYWAPRLLGLCPYLFVAFICHWRRADSPSRHGATLVYYDASPGRPRSLFYSQRLLCGLEM